MTTEQYFENLPDTATKISVSYKPITVLPSLSRFTNLHQLTVAFNNLVELPLLPNSLLYLDCFNNKITSLPTLPQTLKYLLCNNNLLTSLPELPPTLETLYCAGNQLTHLPALPTALRNLDCSVNRLSRLPLLPNALRYLYCAKNCLTVLPELPPNLSLLNCEKTQITRLPLLPNTLTDFYYAIYLEKIYDLETYEDEYPPPINTINHVIQKVNAFREMWFTSKFRNRFLRWIEPIIQRKYHPSNLAKLLRDAGDDEKKIDLLLESW